MILRKHEQRRKGAILALTVICLIACLGFVALSIDLGMMAVARSNAQNAADASAMAGARALNGDVANNNNYSGAGPAAIAAATANKILSEYVTSGQVTLEYGSYTYDLSQDRFVVNIPKAAGDNWSLVRANVAATRSTAFARVMGINAFNTRATATAVHRPRDVAIILDYSGSMRFDSLLGIPFSGSRTMSNNPETVYPLFGHYSAESTAALRNANPVTLLNGEVYGSANITVDTNAGSAIVNDFFQNAAGSPPVRAFTASSDSYATTPNGDNFLRITGNTGASYAKTVAEITGSTSRNNSFETNGYTQYTGQSFKGFTEGPRYWGESFFVWPPDPRSAHDWRRRFFFKADGTTPCDDNTLLWDSSGNWRAPRTSSTNYYRINYNAILQWIKAAPCPFPSRLRAGRILYYDAIPDTISTSTFPPTDMNQRFWKDFIDYVLGVQQTSGSGSSPVYGLITQYTGYGNDYTWGTIQISAKPSTTDGRYMNYSDNPKRPKLRMWFGPMMMIDFLDNYNMGGIASPNYQKHWWWPGTCHESPLWELKIGIQAALQDIERNHPNDFVSLIYFSSPENSPGSPSTGRFNRVRVPLGRDYSRMIDSLWYPPVTLDNGGTDIRPYDYTNNHETPRAMGSTCPAMGFMLAYNQFSSNSSLRNFAPAPAPPGQAGGLGRRGAQKLIILETDGMANTPASGQFVSSGAYNSYYRVRQPGEYPTNSGTVTSQIYTVVDQIVGLDSGLNPGFSTLRKPTTIHCLAFGTLFEPSTSDPDQATALDLLQTIQYKGGTQSSPSTLLPDYKRIVGTADERVSKLRTAFRAIMQDGVQVTLIE
jgi:Flp pilus assembly protein TadG